MLSVTQLDILARGVSATASPMWRSNSQVIYLGSPGGELDYWQVDLERGPAGKVTGGLETVTMDKVGESHVSPDGKWLGYVSAAADKTGENLELEIWLCPLKANGEPQRLTRIGANIGSFGWSPDGKWVAFSSNRYGSYDIYLVSVPNGQTQRLTRSEQYEVYPSFSADSKRVLFVRLNDAWTDHTIYSVDLEGFDERLVILDEDFFDYGYGRTFGYPLVDPAGRWVIFPSYRTGWINYWKVCPDGGAPEVVSRAAADQTEGAWSPSGEAFAYIENHRGNLDLRVLDLQTGVVTTVDGRGCGVCSGPAWSPDGSRLAYIYQDLSQPAQLRVVELTHNGGGYRVATDPRILVGPEEPDLVKELVRPERVCYETFDGRRIDAFLYRPPSSVGDKNPAIVLAHGGPTAQFSETFEHQGTFTSAQYLTMKGYYLLLPNVRGSSGYGREFEDLNNCDWGYGDLEDVAYGVRYLKGLEEVDAEAIGIYGSSYGGSMVMYAVAFKPGLFQAAVARSGYGDRIRYQLERELQHIKMNHYEMGPMPRNVHLYRRSSPYYEIDQVRTPTMVIHGEGRPPYSQDGRRFAEEMKRLMKPVRHRVFQDEGYYVRSVPGRRQVLQEVGEYFDEYLRDIP